MSLNWRVFSWPSLALRKDTLVCAARSERALVVAFDEADFVRTIAAPSTWGNHHDLQPALRAESDRHAEASGRRISLPCHI